MGLALGRAGVRAARFNSHCWAAAAAEDHNNNNNAAIPEALIQWANEESLIIHIIYNIGIKEEKDKMCFVFNIL